MLEKSSNALDQKIESTPSLERSANFQTHQPTGPRLNPEAISARTQQIDQKREEELTQLNAVRGRLDLPPTDASVALSALSEERERLVAKEDGSRSTENTQLTPQTIEIQDTKFGSLAPVLHDSLHVAGSIRRYFEELGPEETMRRVQGAEPGFADMIAEKIRSGDLHQTVWLMELQNPDLRRALRKTNTLDETDAVYTMYGMRAIDTIERLKRADH